MVRFHWHVEGQQSAWVPHKGIVEDEASGVRHITVDMELAGQNEAVQSMLTVPPDYLDSTKVSPLGIVLGHGADAEETWRGPLLERLAAHFAQQGHVVMRYHCPLKEQRRHRIFEKCFDVAAASPYAQPVQRWLFIGYDNGARIAAGVGSKGAILRAPLAGFALLSYPLLQPAPPPPKQKAGASPPSDSVGPLAKLNELRLPLLFVCGEFDRTCPGARLKEVVAEVLPDCDARIVSLEGLSGRYCVPGTKDLEDSTVTGVIGHVQTFVDALKDPSGQGLAASPLTRAADFVPSERPLPDVPESPKREPSPELEEPEPEPEPSPPAARRRGPAKAAAPAAAAAGPRPMVPPGMVPVMGPNGPMLVPAAAAAAAMANPAAQQQMQQALLLQQQIMAAHLQKAAGGAAGTAGPAAVQQQMQLQMALMAQQMAVAQAAAAGKGGAQAAAALAAQQAAAAQQAGQAAPMAVDSPAPQ
ncbi:GMP synthase [glutamine-hydrolyzing] [Chlorella sorokiniana]|uniref:GMP synthase [glutamine-hydrolyzing] n=1 Tax=Chlorella sorokiniana TaxID=3076 RepID=A0A2P6TKW6_CHLSO|nr:GMP synthase [glutamine-hydrolyzing] [Chlorella sorokiniana]|eukprot:PRW44931.1 GMP synthase [glutamine-hydrolyzing] [Chlorella sorokiniana]